MDSGYPPRPPQFEHPQTAVMKTWIRQKYKDGDGQGARGERAEGSKEPHADSFHAFIAYNI